MNVGGGKYVHLRVYQDLQQNVQLDGYQLDKDKVYRRLGNIEAEMETRILLIEVWTHTSQLLKERSVRRRAASLGW